MRIDSFARRTFLGGSDARVVMGQDESALIRLWREKRGELEPQDLSGNLIVQLGVATEPLNRHWFESNTGQTIKDVVIARGHVDRGEITAEQLAKALDVLAMTRPAT